MVAIAKIVSVGVEIVDDQLVHLYEGYGLIGKELLKLAITQSKDRNVARDLCIARVKSKVPNIQLVSEETFNKEILLL